jgi:hypothetical protein
MGSLMGRRVASLLAASGMAVGMLALALFLVSFLSWYTNGFEASADLAVVHAARPVHVVRDGNQHSIGRTAPTAFAEETETTDELPVNAGLLMALLLGFLYGPIRWGRDSASSALPVPRASLPASCRLYSIVCFLQRRSVATLSGVFRL